ncbi:hypothetical protein BJ322DRAFT_1109876 [Thelephora terrestris]|uniref:GATA-type domain-containing protein n=1 Tax=Thelephora terrestris TaxID=56493 RepID=A0A9P6L5D4_9AGAM|nr:hypothetical protein BJ322DRAFT_1109876 [Thelephora terrestris]
MYVIFISRSARLGGFVSYIFSLLCIPSARTPTYQCSSSAQMDSLQFDGYASYQDTSTARTPSPPPNDVSFGSSPYSKPSFDPEAIRNDLHGDSFVCNSWQGQAPQVPYPNSRGSFLQKLHDANPVGLDVPHLDHSQNRRQYSSWTNVPSAAHGLHPYQRYDASAMRRNTFPHVCQDRENASLGLEHDPSFPPRTDSIHPENSSIDSPHLSLVPGSPIGHPAQFHLSSSPATSFRDYERPEGPCAKLEGHRLPIYPSQSYTNPRQTHSPSLVASYPVPHVILIQYTDEASSKETQYLRRLCYNCRAIEPPSWRRSTLTLGKIVCNKCGLYERTHLSPRPLRFDELRAGNKSRKRRRAASSKGPKFFPPPVPTPVKNEEVELISNRHCAPSTDGGAGDCDDPAAGSYPTPRDPNSPIPPVESDGIHLPSRATMLNDFATLNTPNTPPSREESLTQIPPKR